MKWSLIIAGLLFLPDLALSQNTWYVPDDFPEIQQAMDAAVNGDTIMVRPGTYEENLDFHGEAITVQSEMGPQGTMIDGGMIGSVVQFVSGEGLDSVLDGFTLTNGSGNLTGGTRRGGGIYCYQSSSPTIKNNIITGNSAFYGGGICTRYYSSPDFVNNIISGNSGTMGGGIQCHRCESIFMNNTIVGNTASFNGGGIRCGMFNDIKLVNTILWDNSAPLGPQIYVGLTDSPSTLTISYSDVEGGQSSAFVQVNCTLNWGTGMIDSDPQFVDPMNDDHHISWLSPCVNRGTSSEEPSENSSEDIDGDPRPYMGTVDMGADEFVGIHSLAADAFTISAATGGKINFTLNGATGNGNRHYLVLGGLSGTAPGNPLPGGIETLRLNWDGFTDLVLSLLNTPLFWNFLGTLDTSGSADAQLNAPPLPGIYGITMHYAYALNNPWNFVSNPVDIEIVP